MLCVPGSPGVGCCFQHVRNMLFMGFPATFMAELEPQSTLHCSECRSCADSWHNTRRGWGWGAFVAQSYRAFCFISASCIVRGYG